MLMATPALLALNNAHASELSWLEPERLAALFARAYHARALGEADALLIAFDQDSDYDSPNFLWFRARFPRFAYVDRVVVAPEARGRGLGRALYEDLFAKARGDGHAMVGCEVNVDPPNPGSDVFHAALGFVAAGRAAVRDRVVQYLTCRL